MNPTVKAVTRGTLIAGSLFGTLLGSAWILLAQPTPRGSKASEVSVDPSKLRHHVVNLSEDFHPRSRFSVENLFAASEYISDQFQDAGASLAHQDYQIGKHTFRNVIGRFGVGKGSKLVIGAHYDACADTPGADDNASGVAGLIELAYLISHSSIDREVELVAYTLEEPPYFGTTYMGSVHHARAIAAQKSSLKGVIVLEMIGYFSDEPSSQSYPSGFLYLLYPRRGNFAAVVGNLQQRSFTRQVKTVMKNTTSPCPSTP
ncbi:MAG: M28 family peptidase [Verrucomicrobiota bacterium]